MSELPDAPPTHDDTPFDGLSAMQAAGLACVLCNVPYGIPPDVDHVPVGQTPDGRKVYACETACAPALGYVPPAEQLALEFCRDR